MKILLAMRHAKSSWAAQGLSDHERPLNPRGLRDAPRMAAFLSEMQLVPDRAIASTANRAKTTGQLIVQHCDGINCELELEDQFYHAAPQIYINAAAQLADSVQTALFIGHNPGMEELIETLADEDEVMPTAAIACFELQIESWSEILENPDCVLRDVWRPKEVL